MNKNNNSRPSATITRVCLVLAVALASIASLVALPALAEAQDAADVTVEGKGWLYANGTGDVAIDMGGRLRMRVDGNVTITDNAGDMRIRLRGGSDSAEEERTTNVTLTDYRGLIAVRGSDFSVSIDGQVVFNAHGRGQADLVGDGVYKTRNGDRTVWDGLVQLGDPQLEPVG